MLSQWHPFDELHSKMNRLHGEMSRLLGSYDGRNSVSSTDVFPPLNLWDDDHNFYVEAELPGFSMDDFEIHVAGDKQLVIKGERKKPVMEKGTWHRRERGYGSFCRLMNLPEAVDNGRVSAEYKNGVLTVSLPKRTEANPRRIIVKSS